MKITNYLVVLFLFICVHVHAQLNLAASQVVNLLQVTNVGNAQYSTGLVASTNACRLLYISGYSLSTNCFIQVVNTNILATNSMTPAFSFPITASNGYQYSFGPAGAYFDTGIAICLSTNATNVARGNAWTNTSFSAVISLH